MYQGVSTEGNLIFRTNREQDTLIFRKATAESQSRLETSYQRILDVRALQEGGKGFALINYSKDATIVRSFFRYSPVLRLLTISRVLETGDEYAEDYKSALKFIDKGILIDSIKIGSGDEDVLRNVELEYKEQEGLFIAQLEDGATVSLGWSSLSPALSEHKLFLNETSFLWFFHNDGDVGPLTTASFNTSYGQLPVPPFGTSFRLYVKFTFEGNEIDYLWMPGTASNTGSTVRELLIYEDRGDRLVISRAGLNGASSFRDSNSVIDPANKGVYDDFVDLLVDSEGFYVANLGRATPFTNNIYQFISARDPSIRIAFYHVEP